MSNIISDNKKPLIVTPAVCQEYESRSGLIGICAILERRGLIKIVPDEQVGS